MTIYIELGKRAEKYVTFAFWCQDHKMSPGITAQCIELSIHVNRKIKWDTRCQKVEQIKNLLGRAGATEIEFKDDWPWFVSPIGERTCLPIKEFI